MNSKSKKLIRGGNLGSETYMDLLMNKLITWDPVDPENPNSFANIMCFMFEDDRLNQTKNQYRQQMNKMSQYFFTKYDNDVPETVAIETLSEAMNAPMSMTQLTDGNKIHDYFLNPENDIIQEGDALLAYNLNYSYNYFIIGKKNNNFIVLPINRYGRNFSSIVQLGMKPIGNFFTSITFVFHPMLKPAVKKWNNITRPGTTMISTNMRIRKTKGFTKRRATGKRTTRRHQRGGHVVELDAIELQDWTPLQCNKEMNCGPNSMAMLNYFEKNRMEELALNNPDGVQFVDIIKTLTDLYKVPHSLTLISNWSDAISNTKYGTFTFDWKNVLDFILGKNEYTLCFFDYTPDNNEGGHYVVIGRNNNGKLVIHDPQSLKTSIGMRDIMSYLEKLNVYRVFIFNQAQM
jgi:hypothetical protein